MHEFHQPQLRCSQLGILMIVLFSSLQFLPVCEEIRPLRLTNHTSDELRHLTHIDGAALVSVVRSEPLFVVGSIVGMVGLVVAKVHHSSKIRHKSPRFTPIHHPIRLQIVLIPEALHYFHDVTVTLNIFEHFSHQNKVLVHFSRVFWSQIKVWLFVSTNCFYNEIVQFCKVNEPRPFSIHLGKPVIEMPDKRTHVKFYLGLRKVKQNS